jgi:predicted DNA-binding protein (MmcQ/YjbR family)
MDIESLQALCKSFPLVTEDVKWGADLCFSIGGKMFLVTNPDQLPVGASFKCTSEEFEVLIARPGFKPAPYLARHQWVYVEDITLMNGSEWQHFVEQSYQLVKAKLPKKVLKDLGIL